MDNLYLETINTFGLPNQIEKALEELSELTLALHHYKEGKIERVAVIEEIADVTIMMEQLTIIFGKDQVDFIKKNKLDRLLKLVQDKKESLCA